MKPNGEFGGVTLRCLCTGGVTLPPGSEISAEDACSWPVANRRALSEGGTVRWHSVRGGDVAAVDPEPEAEPTEAIVDPVVNDGADAEVSEPAEPEKRRGRPAKAKE